jgi:hypothetical protein
LGTALAQHVSSLRAHPADSVFVRMDAIPIDVAIAIAEAWNSDTALAIASQQSDLFGARALTGAGTGLRNANPTGVCLVVCEGMRLDDEQSLKSFANVAPADMLADPDRIALLAAIEPAVTMVGVVRDVRSAIGQLPVAERPPALSVCAFLDEVARGVDPFVALSALGAFRDDAQGDEGGNPARIRENLQLAGRRRSEELQRHGSLGDIRRRAERVLARRNDAHSDPNDLADAVMRMLQDGDDALLAELTFDEAREILERKQQLKLHEIVAQELDDYRRQREAGEDGPPPVPWDRYRHAAQNLTYPDHRQQAAVDLLAFDDSEQRQCFGTSTRKKLERLLKDRTIRAVAPEGGLLAGALALEGGLGEIRLLAPEPLSENPKPTRRGAVRGLSLSCARLRLKRLLTDLRDSFGIDVDPELLREADPPWPTAFEDAELHAGTSLETVRLQLRAGRGSKDVLVMEWRPDLDDVATLRAAVLFAEEGTLTIEQGTSPTLAGFCSEPPGAPIPVPEELRPVAVALRRSAETMLTDGLSTEVLDEWTSAWREAVESERSRGRANLAEAFALAGTIVDGGAVGMTPLAPLKAEWLSQYLDALWSLLFLGLHEADGRVDEPLEDTMAGVSNATASHYPAHLRVDWSDRPLLPTSETRIWSTYGGAAAENAQHGGVALRGVLQRLLHLQPEAGGNLRCIAAGPGAADLLVRESARLVGNRLAGVEIGRIEIYCIDDGDAARPTPATLADVDDHLVGIGRDRIELRYLPSLEVAQDVLQAETPGAPAVHLGLICGITGEAARLAIEAPDVDRPPRTVEALFVPRTSIRARQARRMLLAPPAATDTGLAWLELMNAMDDGWAGDDEPLRIPELRTTGADFRMPLRAMHDLALWVATLDPYATRDSLQAALGSDVAVLHQERRLGGDSPLGLVISQKSGGPADSAIGRSLQSAGIVEGRQAAVGIGVELRQVAAQGYGILALEAATTGAGVNELVGHVVAFSMLATRTTPWPLPPGCRLILISLDDYKHWFPGKRGDLLVLALDEAERGVHGAVIEVKARRSDASIAATDALDQLRQTLRVTRYAGYPDPETIHSRLWLNRIAEAALAVARESNLKLTKEELEAIESFRVGVGTLEWAGVGLVFGPGLDEIQRDRQEAIAGDLVPITVSSINLTEDLLRSAAGTDLTELRTVEAERQPLGGGRVRRRPEKRPPTDSALKADVPDEEAEEPATAGHADDAPVAVLREIPNEAVEDMPQPSDSAQLPDAPPVLQSAFVPPVLGWVSATGEPVLWHAAGEHALPNGHMEIWGSSGAGKTQFVMALLSQLAATSGTHFGIADFKNDYDGEFPRQARATFVDLWQGAPFNPLALNARDERDIRSAVIELRDIVDVATQSFTRMGVRQKHKLKEALERAYDAGAQEGAWPTLATLNSLLDDDLLGVIGDLTGEPIFGAGKPLGDAVNENVVFGLSKIPGNGLTTVLAAGFILSALQLRMQSLEQVANTVRYAVVVDEAHRVSAFKAIDTMIREGRSKGLAVILATQQPGDLPEVVATNAQTRICFRLPDAAVATAAARRLDPNDRELAEQIRTLGSGEAYVMLGGTSQPRLLRMAQNYRDREALRLDA